MKTHPPSVADLRAIRDRLRQLIADDGRTQAEVAAVANMSPSQLNNLLTGAKDNPLMVTVARVLAALGRTWADLDD